MPFNFGFEDEKSTLILTRQSEDGDLVQMTSLLMTSQEMLLLQESELIITDLERFSASKRASMSPVALSPVATSPVATSPSMLQVSIVRPVARQTTSTITVEI